ncbi:hypothetical protein [Clostridium sp.]|uniref:hypothetical protein n=1 Tax=Clostridium sp. TaxID=1506 RepID=UPI0026DCB0E6|nr:hypothetical protein [Clostridium sp.]MDO5040362.1 hypothetical protein [Clostridium sp.]
MKKTKIIICAVLAFSIFCSTELSTKVYAMGKEVIGWFTDSDQVTNNFNLATIDINTDESFTPAENWNGDKYEKIVKVKNESTANALIRISINPRWVDENENPWVGDINFIQLNFSDSNKWMNGNDGYYYYNEILPKGETTDEILNSVQLNIPQNLKERYKGKTVIIDVDSEAVQATEEGYKAIWKNLNPDIENILNGLCKGR